MTSEQEKLPSITISLSNDSDICLDIEEILQIIARNTNKIVILWLEHIYSYPNIEEIMKDFQDDPLFMYKDEDSCDWHTCNYQGDDIIFYHDGLYNYLVEQNKSEKDSLIEELEEVEEKKIRVSSKLEELKDEYKQISDKKREIKYLLERFDI